MKPSDLGMRDAGSGRFAQVRSADAAEIQVARSGAARRPLHDAPPLKRSNAKSGIARLIACRPEMKRILHTAFVSAKWNVLTRRTRAADHCRIVDRLGAPFNVAPDEYAVLARLPMIGTDYRVTIDQPRWLLRDGLLALSLWEGSDRLFSLSFLLATENQGLVAYIGGIQGRGDPDALDRYRILTKAACGMMPRALLLDLFRMTCVEIGVHSIRAVSNASRFQNSFYYRYIKRAKDETTLDYDKIWIEKGGVLGRDALFELASAPQMRHPDEVPARKRGLYRARRAMLTEIAVVMSTALGMAGQICIERHDFREADASGHKNEYGSTSTATRTPRGHSSGPSQSRITS